MSPQEASEVIFEEPDWKDVFEEEQKRWPKLPKYLAEDSAFESVLKKWRLFHATDDRPAGAVEGMIALTTLGVMPPRSLIKGIERTGELHQEQIDDHCWLTMSQRAWRIMTIESRVMFLESFGEQTQVDLSRAKWEKYVEKAVEALQKGAPTEMPVNVGAP